MKCSNCRVATACTVFSTPHIVLAAVFCALCKQHGIYRQGLDARYFKSIAPKKRIIQGPWRNH